jgi:hypothetical protein
MQLAKKPSHATVPLKAARLSALIKPSSNLWEIDKKLGIYCTNQSLFKVAVGGLWLIENERKLNVVF